jgi:ribonuclease Z
MPKLVFLGTSNAVASQDHANAHMAIVGEKNFVLIDCVNNPVLRLQQVGQNALDLQDLILTHFHPDHVSGVPTLLMSSWLLGRRAPLNIYGLAHTLDRIEGLMDSYDWDNWPNFFPVKFVRLPEKEMTPVFENEEMRFYASPVGHLIPTIGLRVEFLKVGKTMAYSCDTGPCENVIRLADHVDVLIHEASGAMPGHTSAAQAGKIARQASAKKLYLIHYRTWDYDPHPLGAEAEKTFGGPVTLAEDFMSLEF